MSREETYRKLIQLNGLAGFILGYYIGHQTGYRFAEETIDERPVHVRVYELDLNEDRREDLVVSSNGQNLVFLLSENGVYRSLDEVLQERSEVESNTLKGMVQAKLKERERPVSVLAR